jgi:ribulose-5-phosphate 4-epimerase/fuculose-1-phosphate aldolase
LEQSQDIATTLGQNKAVILRNHGLLTVGRSVDETAWWFITMDRSCQSQLMAEAAGTPVLIHPDTASLTYRQVGSHFMGWFSFQSLYDMIVRQQPDLLE